MVGQKTSEREKEKSKSVGTRRANHCECVHVAILFLASKEARWITGLIMPVDGGVRAPSIPICHVIFLLTGNPAINYRPPPEEPTDLH